MDGSATFTIVTSRTIISCARQTTTSDAQRRRSELRLCVETEAMCMWGALSGGSDRAKMEGASEISGGGLQKYTEGASVCQGSLMATTETSTDTLLSRPK